MTPEGDNQNLLCQDCNRRLFRWFFTRIDWKRVLKELVK
jgi:hypothetical protein